MMSRNFMVKYTKIDPFTLCHTLLQVLDPLPKWRHNLQPLPFKKAVIIACRNKSNFSLIHMSAMNMTLFAFAAERQTCQAATHRFGAQI